MQTFTLFANGHIHIIITLSAKISKFDYFHHRLSYCELSENAEILSTGDQFAAKKREIKVLKIKHQH